VDRYGDTLAPNGWKASDCVALFGHDAGSVENVIGRVKNIRVVGGKLMGDIEFASAEINPMADTVYKMLLAGFLNAVSVGFLPIEWEQTKDKSRPGGIDFKRQELVEASVVPIPANPNALLQAKAAGIDVSPFADWAKRELQKDKPIMSRASLNTIHRDFRSPRATTIEQRRETARARRDGPFAEPKARSTGGFESLGHFARALIVAGRDNTKIDERLVRAGPSGASEVDPTGGGFLIPDAFSDMLNGSLWEESVIAPLVDHRVTDHPENMSLPGVDETSRATGSRWGGVESYFEGEGTSVTNTTNMKIRQIRFKATKLIGVVIATEDLVLDVPLLSSHLLRAYSAEAGAQLDRAILVGTGVGLPLGVVGAPGTISIAKDVSQAAGTITSSNIANMWSRLVPSCRRKACWIINGDAEGALELLGTSSTSGMYFPAGAAGGNEYPLIKGRPAYVSEFCPQLGSPGDIVLGCWDQYCVIDGGVRAALSMEVKFLTYECAFKFTYRVDGRPIWSAPIQQFNDGVTQAPFVTIQQR
jgi:HK97 family phage major capsid protein/HK97 family phage prohead protease